ncbi:MAG: rane protein [Acidobacteriota bacterium]|nr:rane protein [Acidobacteriota bacterium]
MENVRRPFPLFSRGRWGVKNRAPWWSILQHTFHQFHENDLFTPAAAMSYFGLLTLFPALLVMLAIGNRFEAGSEALTRIVEIYPGSREFLRATIRSLKDVGWGGIISASVVTLWAGSWVFAVIERALNRIWGTRPRAFLHGRALTLGMIGAVGVLLILSVFMTSILVGLQELIDQLPIRVVRRSPWMTLAGNAFWQSLFAVVYRLVPNGRVTLRDTLPSAIVAGLMWEAAKYVFASSLQYFHYDEIYGSVGAVVAVLTWSYVSSLILMFGAQLSVVLHQEHAGAEIAAETPASPS